MISVIYQWASYVACRRPAIEFLNDQDHHCDWLVIKLSYDWSDMFCHAMHWENDWSDASGHWESQWTDKCFYAHHCLMLSSYVISLIWCIYMSNANVEPWDMPSKFSFHILAQMSLCFFYHNTTTLACECTNPRSGSPLKKGRTRNAKYDSLTFVSRWRFYCKIFESLSHFRRLWGSRQM